VDAFSGWKENWIEPLQLLIGADHFGHGWFKKKIDECLQFGENVIVEDESPPSL
jgi:hypothetical protein